MIIAMMFVVGGALLFISHYRNQDDLQEFKDEVDKRIADVRQYASVIRSSSQNNNLDIKSELLKISKRIDNLERKQTPGASIADKPEVRQPSEFTSRKK